MKLKLEPGTAEAVYNNQKDNPLYDNPVFQVLRHDISTNQKEGKPRARANLSDGVFSIRAIFSSEYTELFERGLIKDNSLVKINNFLIQSKDESTFLYIRKIEEYEHQNLKIGKPVSINTKKNNTPSSNNESIKPNYKVESISSPTKKIKTDCNYNPIISLNPFQARWIIKGSVVSKSEIRTFKNQKGEGKIFSMEFADDSAQMKIVAFTESVDIFFPIFEVGKTYSISKGGLKMANKQYSSNNFEYELHLDKGSEVVILMEENKLRLNFDFTKILDIAVKDQMFDVIGVVKDLSPATKITVKSTQKEVLKRDIVLVDDTGSIRLTLWGAKTEIDLENNPVIALKGVKASEFQGISLSTVGTSQIIVNPDIEGAFELRGWYDEIGKDLKIEAPRREQAKNNIQEIKDNELPFSYIIGNCIFMKEDTILYDSCLGDNCSKKVTPEGNGKYRCERCNKVYDGCNQRYMISMNVADYTGQLWCTLFNNTADGLFKISATDFKELAQNNLTQSQGILKSLYFKETGFKLKSRVEIYNDEHRTKYSVLDAARIDILKESKKMIENLNQNIII